MRTSSLPRVLSIGLAAVALAGCQAAARPDASASASGVLGAQPAPMHSRNTAMATELIHLALGSRTCPPGVDGLQRMPHGWPQKQP